MTNWRNSGLVRQIAQDYITVLAERDRLRAELANCQRDLAAGEKEGRAAIEAYRVEKTRRERLETLLERTHVHGILFRNAGVGFQFYEGGTHLRDDGREHLCVYNYYPTLQEAVEAEHERLDAAMREK